MREALPASVLSTAAEKPAATAPATRLAWPSASAFKERTDTL